MSAPNSSSRAIAESPGNRSETGPAARRTVAIAAVQSRHAPCQQTLRVPPHGVIRVRRTDNEFLGNQVRFIEPARVEGPLCQVPQHSSPADVCR